jgi:uncharacterized protein YerC
LRRNRVSFEAVKRIITKRANGKNKALYDKVVRCLKENMSVMNIHLKTGLSRNTICSIKLEIEKPPQLTKTQKVEG